MSFQDWIGEDPDAPDGRKAADADGGPADDFTHAARLRAQAERESNRLRRRHRWRARAVLLRRMSNRQTAARPAAGRDR